MNWLYWHKSSRWDTFVLFHLYGNKGVSWPIRPQWFNTFSPCAEPFRDGHEGMWVRFGSQGSLNWHSRYSGTWILLIWPLGTNFSEILIKIHTFSCTKMCWKISSEKWLPFCLGLNTVQFVPFVIYFVLCLSLLSLHCVPTEQCHSSSCLVVTSGTLMIL